MCEKVFVSLIFIALFITSGATYSKSLRCGKGYATCLASERESKSELITCCGKPAKALTTKTYDPDNFEPIKEWYLYKCKSGRLKKVTLERGIIVKVEDAGETKSGFQHCS